MWAKWNLNQLYITTATELTCYDSSSKQHPWVLCKAVCHSNIGLADRIRIFDHNRTPAIALHHQFRLQKLLTTIQTTKDIFTNNANTLTLRNVGEPNINVHVYEVISISWCLHLWAILVHPRVLSIVDPGITEHEPYVVNIFPGVSVLASVQALSDSWQVHRILDYVKIVLKFKEQGTEKMYATV